MNDFIKDKDNFAFDLNKIFSYIHNNDKLAKETEIVDLYEMDAEGKATLTNKTIREAKNTSLDQIDGVKYDLVKLLITSVLSDGDNEYNNTGSNISFNTLLENEFIYEINK